MRESQNEHADKKLVAAKKLTPEILNQYTETRCDFLALNPEDATFPPGTDFYGIAREVVDVVRKNFDDVFEEEFMARHKAGFESFFFSHHFIVALDELASLSLLRSLAEDQTQIDLWNSMLPKALITSIVGEERTIELLYQVEEGSLRTLQASYCRPPIKDSVGLQGVPLITLGSAVDLDLGLSYFEVEPTCSACNLLLKRNEEDLVERFKDALPHVEIGGVYYLRQLSETEVDVGDEILAELLTRCQLHPHLYPLMTGLIAALNTAYALEMLVKRLKPSRIFGTFEKSPIGVVLSTLHERYGFHLSSYQHGVLARTHTLGMFEFDTFYVWSNSYAGIATDEGYGDSNTFVIVDRRQRWNDDPYYQPLFRLPRSWCPGGRCFLFLEQPLGKGPYSMREYKRILGVVAGLARQFKFKVLLKPHPSTYRDRRYVDAGSDLSEIARLSDKVTFAEAIRRCEFAIGFTSSGLLDFQNAGKTSISFDPIGWGQMMGLPKVFDFTATNERELTEIISNLTETLSGKVRFCEGLRRKKVHLTENVLALVGTYLGRVLRVVLPRSRLGFLALATAYKKRKNYRCAADAYLSAGVMTEDPEKYLYVAIKMFLQAGLAAMAIERFLDMMRPQAKDQWFYWTRATIRLLMNGGLQERVLARARERWEGNADLLAVLLWLSGERKDALAIIQHVDWQGHPMQFAFAETIGREIYESCQDRVRIRQLPLLVPVSVEEICLREAEWVPLFNAIGRSGDTRVVRSIEKKSHVIVDSRSDAGGLSRMCPDGVVYVHTEKQASQAVDQQMDVMTIKELVPDQSAESAYAREQATCLSPLIVSELLSVVGDTGVGEVLTYQRKAVELRLEDRIARVFLELEWYLGAVRQCGDDRDLLLYLSGREVLPILPWICALKGKDRLFLQLSATSGLDLDEVVRFCRGQFGPETPVRDIPRSVVSTDQLEHWDRIIKAGVLEIVDSEASLVGEHPVLVVADLAHRNYREGNQLLIQTLVEKCHCLVLSNCTDCDPTETKNRFQTRTEVTLTEQSLLGEQICAELVAKVMASQRVQMFEYHGLQIRSLIYAVVERWGAEDLELALAEHHYLQQTLDRHSFRSIILSPGRTQVGYIATTLAHDHGVVCLDVQMVNTPEYAKYKPPLADLVTVIDHDAAERYRSGFGTERRALHVVGSPKLDWLKSIVLDNYRVDRFFDGGNLTICFASQMQPLEKCLNIVRTLADFLRENVAVNLLVKLHPRETGARRLAYEDALSAIPAKKWRVMQSAPMSQVYANSEILVTMYSNVAREALLLGKHVLIANFNSELLPATLGDDYVQANSASSLFSQLEVACRRVNEGSVVSNSYLLRNSHLLRGRSVDRIVNLAVER